LYFNTLVHAAPTNLNVLKLSLFQISYPTFYLTKVRFVTIENLFLSVYSDCDIWDHLILSHQPIEKLFTRGAPPTKEENFFFF
jgi:hypothetical protein